jgi:hypothetical protein
MISLEIKSDITLKEIGDAVYTAGVGYRIYKIWGIPIYKKIYSESLLPQEDVKTKEDIGFNKKK